MRLSESLRSKLSELRAMTSEPGWDQDDHEVIIPSETWELAVSWLSSLPDDYPEPFVSPCGDGTVHMSWSVGLSQLVVEVGSQWWQNLLTETGPLVFPSTPGDCRASLARFLEGRAA